jgi:hypothetical protein
MGLDFDPPLSTCAPPLNFKSLIKLARRLG